MSEGFDLKVHHRDKKTGRVVKTTPYQMKVSKEHGTYFIRKGVEYYPDGTIKNDPGTVEEPQEKKKPGRPKKEEGEQ